MEQSITMGRRAGISGMRAFLLIMFGQFISLLGSGLTDFALGVWVYQRTGSATQFTLIAFFAIVPFLLFSPIAGALVDRRDRRRALIISEIGASITPIALVIFVLTGT